MGFYPTDETYPFEEVELTVKACEVKKGDQLRGGWHHRFGVTAVAQRVSHPGRPDTIEIVASGPPTRQHELVNMRMESSQELAIYRTQRKDPFDGIIAEAKMIMGQQPGTTYGKVLGLIVKLAQALKEHRHTDGPGVNHTSKATMSDDEARAWGQYT